MNREEIVSKIGNRVGVYGLIAVLGMPMLGATTPAEAAFCIRELMDRVMDEARQMNPGSIYKVKTIVYFRFVMSGLIGCPDLRTCSRLYEGESFADEDITFMLD